MRIYPFLFAALFLPVVAKAQFALGVSASEYSTINSMYLNPANLADCKEKITVNLFSLNLFADNDLGTVSRLSDVFTKNASASFTSSGGRIFSMLAPYGEARGPALLIRSNGEKKSALAITTRVRVMNQLNNFDERLYNAVAHPGSVSDKTVEDASQTFNWSAQLWSEVGISYGIKLIDKKNSQLNAGVTLRYLGSLGYVALKGSYVNVAYQNESDAIKATKADIEYASNILMPSGALASGVDPSNIFHGFLGTTGANGAGVDIGINYTYRFYNGETDYGDDYDTREHKLRLSAAVTDMGHIKYKEGYNYTLNISGTGNVSGSGIAANANNYSEFENYVLTQGFTIDTNQNSTKMHLPTALILGADYDIYGHLYANMTYVANLVVRNNFGKSFYNRLTLTPRYDMKWFGIGIPITYSSLAHDYKVGVGCRIYSLFFGSDDMLALVSNHQHGLGAYFGASVPIYR